jgi:DNA-binding transcriptional LysR family regulator
MDWDKLRAFHAAAEAGSFTNAGARLNLSQSAVSRQITALEEGLHVVLFHRHARGLKLTQHGELLQDAVREVMARLSLAEARLMDLRDEPRGPLRISCDVAFGTFWLAPRLKELHELYPEITPILLLDGGTADLAMGQADVAICMSVPERAGVVQRRIFSTRAYAYAAPDYVRRHGLPCRAEELGRHRLVVESGDGQQIDARSNWLLTLEAEDDPRRPVAMLDGIQALFRAVASGLGIGALPHFMGPETAGLVRILSEAASPKSDGYFVYPAELRRSKRVIVFRDFLIRKIAESRLNLDLFDTILPVPYDPPIPRRMGAQLEADRLVAEHVR